MTFAGKYPKPGQDEIYQPTDNIAVEDPTARNSATLSDEEEESPGSPQRPSLLSGLSPDQRPSPYFKKVESKIELGRESIRSMCRPEA